MNQRTPITHTELLKWLHYDPESGTFTRLKYGKGRNCPISSTHVNGYLRVTVSGERFLAHRVAWFYVTGSWPDGFIDHINGVRNDNRFKNLRVASRFENQSNMKRMSRNSSGVKGVSWAASHNMWLARIHSRGVNYHLGRFREFQDAVEAVRKGRLAHHGEFANHG